MTLSTMVKVAILATLLASASAFAPANMAGRQATKLFEDAAAEPEAPAPPAYKASQALPFLEYPPNLAGYAGDTGFDPFRFSDFVPMDFLREAELKHCRICMLATVGFISVDMGFRIYPLPEAYEGLTALTAHDALVKSGAMGQLFLWIGISEFFQTIAVTQMLNGSGRKAGDFGFDPLNMYNKLSDAGKDTMELKELTNGRLAMLAFSGIITQAVLTGNSFPFTY